MGAESMILDMSLWDPIKYFVLLGLHTVDSYGLFV